MDVNNWSENETNRTTNNGGKGTYYKSAYENNSSSNSGDDEEEDGEGDEETTTTASEETDELNDDEIAKVFNSQSKKFSVTGRCKFLNNPTLKNFCTVRGRSDVDTTEERVNSDSESVESSLRTSSQTSMSPVVSEMDEEDEDVVDTDEDELKKRDCSRKMVLERQETGGNSNKVMDMINLSPDNQVIDSC